MRFGSAFGAALLLIGSACAGVVSEPAADDDDGFVEGGLQIAATDLRRLTRTEYESVLRTLMGDALVDGQSSALSSLPADATEAFESMVDPTVALAHVDGWIGISESIAVAASQDDAWLSGHAACLPAGTAERTCAEELARSFGRMLFDDPSRKTSCHF